MRRWVLVAVVCSFACNARRESSQAPAGSAARTHAAADARGPSADAAGDPPPPPDAEPPVVRIPDTAPARRLFTGKLDDAATFESYSKEVGGERFTKLVIDLKTDAIYYFDVNVYLVHKDFIFAELYKQPKTPQAVRRFDRNYGANKTEFLMCYLVHHLQQDAWTFAFWDGDLANEDHVRRAYRRIKDTFFLGDRVRFRPDSNHQEAVARRLGDVPFVLNDQLYKQAEYQAFNKGAAIGTLRIVPADATEADLVLAPDEIVVLPGTLSDITPVAGIVSETFSSPLSHVSLRAKGWRIPNVGLRGASTKLAGLAGKLVYFEARDADYVLRAASDAEVEIAKARRAEQPRVEIPRPDLAMTELRTIARLTRADAHTVGPKAANLGAIIAAQLPGFAVPPGFVVPFHYYDAHVRTAGIDQLIAAALADPVVQRDAGVRRARLAAIRKAIVDAPLATDLCSKIETALAELPPGGGVFVRSTHNAEDLDAFSGAGLHDTIPNVRTPAAVCNAVKQVWASAWKLTAYDARSHAGIDQSLVAAAALIQTGVEATAAGVLATTHPTDPTDDRNYTINAKSGLGIAVVDGGKVPEILLVSWYNHGVRVLSRSDEEKILAFDPSGGVREVPNPRQRKPVLSNKQAILLADTGKRLTQLFANPRLDIEWIYAGDQLYIVQTRPLVGP